MSTAYNCAPAFQETGRAAAYCRVISAIVKAYRNSAVKKQARVFKSVLKLDKNFHIYIHGNRELIEQGMEPDGRKYYKIYFKEES